MNSPIPIIFLLLLLPLLLLSLSPSHAINQQTAMADQQSFLHCLYNQKIPSSLIFASTNKAYKTLLFSSIRNPRTLFSSHKPLVIITPNQESHVQSIVSCSKDLNLPIRIRSGGHDYEGLSYASIITTPSFVIIDLQKLHSVTVDETHGEAWVQAGATLGELYYAIAIRSKILAFPAGTCPTMGVGGHFSGGGLGTMMRAHGLSIDNIVDARIVTANGDILDRESMGEDLFWAIRGGGSSFGVILSYKINLVQVPRKVTVFSKSKIIEEGAVSLLNKWQEIGYNLDRKLFIQAILQKMDEDEQKKMNTFKVSFNSLFLGEKKDLLPLVGESFPELELEEDDCMEMSWIESVLYFSGFSIDQPLSSLLDRQQSSNFSSFKSKSDFVTNHISKRGWEEICGWIMKEDKYPVLIISPSGGKMDEISEAETPYPHRKGSLYDIQYFLSWSEEEKEVREKNLEWMKKLYNFMGPYVSRNPRAAYLNYRDLDLGLNGEGNSSYMVAREWGKKYFKGNFRRLALVKTKIDPGNFFRHEQSIPLLF